MNETRQRLFFALWPDASIGPAIDALASDVARHCGGRATPAGNAHVTLAFLGDQPASMVRRLGYAASSISVPAFELALDRVGSWRRSAVAWLGVRDGSHVPAPLRALHGALLRCATAAGIEMDERPFMPHVTLARHIAASVRRTLPAPLVWHAAFFSLVSSDLSPSGPRYSVLSSWPLA